MEEVDPVVQEALESTWRAFEEMGRLAAEAREELIYKVLKMGIARASAETELFQHFKPIGDDHFAYVAPLTFFRGRICVTRLDDPMGVRDGY